MIIAEAIKYIISKQDDSILVNSERFMEYLRELVPDDSKKFKVLKKKCK